MLLEIDLQGAEQVRDRHPDAVLVLLLPPSPEVQAERLRMRGEDPETIAARLAVGRAEELRGSQIADAIVVNDDIERAVAEVGSILAALPHASGTPAGRRPPQEDPDGPTPSHAHGPTCRGTSQQGRLQVHAGRPVCRSGPDRSTPTTTNSENRWV